MGKRYYWRECQGGVILDVGANIGDDTVYYGKELIGVKKIYAFEPIIRTYEILETNVRINQLTQIVETINCACGKQEGSARIENVPKNNIGGTSIKSEDDGDLKVITIDGLNIENVAYIKIDVEGFELDVIEGAIETIKRCRPYLYIEIPTKKNFAKINKMLKAIGYKCYYNPKSNMGDYLFYIKNKEI